jgi:D-alanyl-D-alanine carboxypeptidase
MGRRSGKAGGWAGVALAFALSMVVPERAAAEPRYQEMARQLVGPDQGVFARAEDGTVLAAVAADVPVHPASVTKVASTLALLAELGPDYRFRTRVLAGGPVREGVVAGDLLIQAGGDPFLVSEDALLMLASLRCIGIGRVDGRLRVVGEAPLVFNWEPDPAARRLTADLAGTASPAAWLAVANAETGLLDRGPASLGLRFGRKSIDVSGVPQPLIEYRSPPLRRILKELNGFSNNIFHPFSGRVGGPDEVQKHARAAIDPSLRAEIVIDNAAGAGKTNRFSPRAAAALIDALAAELRRRGLDLPDVLPVAGIDPGTLSTRFTGPAFRGVVVGKTGTIPSIRSSALAGIARTRAHGAVTFAILNHALPVPEARRRQDAFVQALIGEAGGIPWKYEALSKPPFSEAKVDAVVDGHRCDVPPPEPQDRALPNRRTGGLGK